jgi:dTDP-N-acetylfucosamine:lipid II N-acetylfucosaminyltransferase
MVKLLHLFSNHRLVDGHIARFENAGFSNAYVYLTGNDSYSGLYMDRVKQVEPFSASFEAMIGTATAFDIILVYNLDYPKSYFVNRIDKKILVIWYFYGTELYNELNAFKYAIHSKDTKKLLGENRYTGFLGKAKRIASIVKHRLLRKRPSYQETIMAMRRINYFTTFSGEEYNYLQRKSGVTLPPFLPLPVYTGGSMETTAFSANRKFLLLGHAASPDGNHADIIKLLSVNRYRGKIIVPLSYGENQAYTLAIRNMLAAAGLDTVILDSFLNPLVYAEKIGDCGVAVFNSYRQLAVGTILLALQKGLKVYLNEINPSYQWLLNLGFTVFSVQQHLEQDIQSGALFLKEEQFVGNREMYKKMADPQNNFQYLQGLKKMVQEHYATP